MNGKNNNKSGNEIPSVKLIKKKNESGNEIPSVKWMIRIIINQGMKFLQ